MSAAGKWFMSLREQQAINNKKFEIIELFERMGADESEYLPYLDALVDYDLQSIEDYWKAVGSFKGCCVVVPVSNRSSNA